VKIFKCGGGAKIDPLYNIKYAYKDPPNYDTVVETPIIGNLNAAKARKRDMWLFNGLCHQLANRILSVCEGSPVIKPKGYEITWLLFGGPYGFCWNPK